jgi:hypothetical protein
MALRAEERKLEYAPAPVANPLKGLVPYPGAANAEKFPHSMEFVYLRLDELVVGEHRNDWSKLEGILGKISARGNQAVMRAYVEYPKKPIAVPRYLRESGKGLRADGFPDYESPELRGCLRDFVAAFGKRYDGDPRVAFLCAGLLGKWGEWHTWPEHDRWASKAAQEEILDAYEVAFKKTPVVLRYPRGSGDEKDAENASRPFGYHDDSFAWSTLQDGSKWDDGHFMGLLKTAGDGALQKWRRYPIGGEIRPEAWGIVFDAKPADPKVQDFAECVRATHVSWLMDSGLFNESTWTEARRARAAEQVRRMGYELHVSAVTTRLENTSLHVAVKIENRGVAPFYADWPIEFGLLDGNSGEVLRSVTSSSNLREIFPGEGARERSGAIGVAGVATQGGCLAMRIANPMRGGLPLRFANKTQDQHASGWLSLIEFKE